MAKEKIEALETKISDKKSQFEKERDESIAEIKELQAEGEKLRDRMVKARIKHQSAILSINVLGQEMLNSTVL